MNETPAPLPNTSPRPERRWYRFSLRKMLFAMLLVALALAWVGAQVKRVLDRRRAVEALTAAGASVTYFDSSDTSDDWLQSLLRDRLFPRVRIVTFGKRGSSAGKRANSSVPVMAHVCLLTDLVRLDLKGQDVTDEEVKHLRRLPHLIVLDLSGTSVTDVGVASLVELPNLQSLNLNDTRVTDAGLASLPRMKRLETLTLRRTTITDAGLAHLRGMSPLQSLVLGDTQVTDAGLAHLSGLTELQLLDLENTAVTSEGMTYLEGLPNLALLSLRQTQVSRERELELRKRMPRLLISR